LWGMCMGANQLRVGPHCFSRIGFSMTNHCNPRSLTSRWQQACTESFLSHYYHVILSRLIVIRWNLDSVTFFTSLVLTVLTPVLNRNITNHSSDFSTNHSKPKVQPPFRWPGGDFITWFVECWICNFCFWGSDVYTWAGQNGRSFCVVRLAHREPCLSAILFLFNRRYRVIWGFLQRVGIHWISMELLGIQHEYQ
jgi:hypothetical protein